MGQPRKMERLKETEVKRENWSISLSELVVQLFPREEGRGGGGGCQD